MIVVIVTSRIRKGCMAAFLAACAELKPKVLAEDGCLGYQHMVPEPWPLDSGGPAETDRVVLIETWASDEALRRHAGVPHGKAFAQQVTSLRESVSIEAFRAAPGVR